MKRKLSMRELFVYGLPVLSLMVAAIAYFVLISPQKSRANELAGQVVGAQAALIAAHQKPPKPVSAHAVELFHLTTAMPDSSDVPGLLLDLTRLSQASKVTLQTVTPQAEVPLSTGYDSMPVNISINGTFPDVSDFLKLLRTQVSMTNGNVHATGRLLIANNLQFSTTDGSTVTATIDLDAFVYSGGASSVLPPTTG